MEERDEIIVLQVFENSIDANIAQTKLDANGIQCFLTEENLANLFPVQSAKLFGVRLHVFSRDKDQALQILHEQIFIDREEINCPKCQSGEIEIEYSRKLSSRIITLMIGFLLLIGFPMPKVYRCQVCGHEF